MKITTQQLQLLFDEKTLHFSVAAKDVLKELSHLYDNENPLVPIDIEFICKANRKAQLTARALGKTVTVTGTVPEKAINKPMTEDSVTGRLAKFGNTQFYLNNITIDLDDGLILPASVINSMRREAVEMLDKVEIQPFTQMPYKAERYKEKDCTPYYTARFLNPDSIPDKHPFKRIFIPIWSSDEDFVDNRAGVEISRGLFGMEEKLTKRLEHLKKIGVRKALCSNLGAYSLAQKMGFEVYGDFGLNIFNSESAQLFNSPILSFEATIEQTNRIGAKDTGIIGYGYLPLMLTRNCPIKNHLGCSRCTGKLTDRKGFEFKVKCSPYPCVEVLNPVPVYMGDRQKEIKTDFIHFYFTDESKNQVEQIINLFKTGGQFDGKYTRGLTYRGVE